MVVRSQPDSQLAPRVEQLLGSPFFTTRPRLADALRFLLLRTLAGEGASAEDVARESGKTKHDAPPDFKALANARTLIHKLNERLDEAQEQITWDDGYAITVTHGRRHFVDLTRAPTITRRHANAREFARLVRAICALRGIGAAQRSERFRLWRAEHRGPMPAIEQWARLLGTDDFDAILDGIQRVDIMMSIEDLREVGSIFEIHALLLDPLISKPVVDPALVLDLDADFQEFSEGDEEFRGHGAEYRIPVRRIGGTDAVFVRLRLQGKGQSDVHEHPGDELVFVRSGQVEVQFAQSGVAIRLRAGEFMHYYAEQRHGVVNVSNAPAELFIVRVFQTDREGTRQGIVNEIRDALPERPDADSTVQLSSNAVGLIRQLMPAYQPESTGDIVDALGYSRFIERWLQASLDASAPPQSDLIPPFLMQSFAHPAVPNVIAIRQDEFDPVPPELLPAGVSYLLPRRNLLCSDISIAKVTIRARGAMPAAGTLESMHPGFEALLISRGEVELFYDGDEPVCTISTNENQFCHFNSAIPHRIVNPSETENAELLLIRFYRDGA